jgi:hypothetical protein
VFLLDKFFLCITEYTFKKKEKKKRTNTQKQHRYSNDDVHEILIDVEMMIDDDDEFDGIYFHYRFLYGKMKLYDEEMH